MLIPFSAHSRRLFVGVKPTAEALAGLLGAQGEARSSFLKDVPARWLDEGQLHLTVHFLSEVDESKLDRLVTDLGRATQALAEARQSFNHWMFLPSAEKARVVSLGAAATTPSLAAVFDATVPVMAGLGIELEKREYRPHLSLARFSRPPRLPAMALPTVALEFPIPALHLFESHLEKGGSRYEILGEFPLRKRPRP